MQRAPICFLAECKLRRLALLDCCLNRKYKGTATIKCILGFGPPYLCLYYICEDRCLLCGLTYTAQKHTYPTAFVCSGVRTTTQKTQPPTSPLLHPSHNPLRQMTAPSPCQVLIQLALALIILPMTDYQRGYCLRGCLNE